MDLIPSTEIRNDLFRESETGNGTLSSVKEFTAARFFAQQPQQYREIASLRAEGLSIASLARLFFVSRHTIAAIDRRETATETFAKHRATAAQSYCHLIKLGCERLEEILLDPDSKLSAKDLSIMIGVLEDKAQLLSGGPTQRVELGDADAAGHSSLVAHLKELKAEYDRQQMGCGGGNVGQRAVEGESWVVPVDDQDGADSGPADADPGGPGSEQNEEALDNESDV